jgi:hypothetical protein
MKRISFLLSILFFAFRLAAQDSLKYDYAMLDIEDYKIFINYSDGRSEDLSEVHWPSVKFFRNNTFPCFQYLNSQGYELVTSLYGPPYENHSGVCEYIFKRPKKVVAK